MKKLNVLAMGLLTLVMAFSTTTVNAGPDRDPRFSKRVPTPENFDKYMVFVSDKAYDSVDGTFFKGGFGSGDSDNYFYNVLGWDDTQIEESRVEAVEFLGTRFGIDVETDPSVVFTSFEAIPEAGYRVVVSSGRNINSKGWPVIDGGWGMMVVNPDGITLGGEFEGVHVPAGTMMGQGFYVVVRDRGPNLMIKYQARGPMMPAGTGGVINCEVYHEKHGWGLGLGYFELHQLTNGQSTAQVRNVLTFPGFGIEEELLAD